MILWSMQRAILFFGLSAITTKPGQIRRAEPTEQKWLHTPLLKIVLRVYVWIRVVTSEVFQTSPNMSSLTI